MVKITYQGHSAFKFVSEAGVIVYVDPYKCYGYDEPGDLCISSHNHYDHAMYRSVSLKLDGEVIDVKSFIVNGEYQTINYKGIKIQAVPAYNEFHPKGTGVGFLIDVDGILIYHTGDTGQIEEMDNLKGLDIDLMFIPIDGMFTMSPEDAMGVNEFLEPKIAVPVHMCPGKLFSYKHAIQFRGPNVKIMMPGDRLDLEAKKR